MVIARISGIYTLCKMRLRSVIFSIDICLVEYALHQAYIISCSYVLDSYCKLYSYSAIYFLSSRIHVMFAVLNELMGRVSKDI